MALRLGPHTLDNPWILAPMAGVSEMPYRRIARELGAAAAPTELVSAKGLLHGQRRTERYLAHAPDERPFWVQLFGGERDAMAAGAQRAVALGAQILDVNMGCPVRKVTRTGAGSALLADPARAAAIVAAVARAGVPVTVKIRSGWDRGRITALEVTRAVADAGAVAVALHARTRADGYSGHADWDLIARLVAASPIPVIGNGDAFTAADARRMLSRTGCAAVMIGRGALGNPWIFSELAHGRPAPAPKERFGVVRRHLLEHIEHDGDPLRAIRRFRPHLAWYARGLRGVGAFRERVFAIEELEELLEVVEAFFSRARPVALGSGAPEPVDELRALG